MPYTPPEPDPIDLATLAQVKAYLRIKTDDTASDATLARVITAASSFIQEILNRRFALADYVDRINGNGAAHVVFSNYPAAEVSSVKIGGREIPPAQDAVSSGYTFDRTAIYLRGYTFAPGVQNVEISYSAGYDDGELPPVITDCCIELVGKKYKYSDRIGHLSKILAGETITYERSDLTDELKSILRNFQKVVPN